MDYREVVESLEKSRNPLVKKMISNSQEVVDLWKKLIKVSEMNEKSRLDYILKHSILQIEYTNSKGERKTYRCTSNPYFVALLSTRKFAEYKTVSKDLLKKLSCHRTGHLRTWDLVKNDVAEFVIKKIKPNFFNAIGINVSSESISDESKELINETFKNLKPNRNEDNDDKKSDLEELFRM